MRLFRRRCRCTWRITSTSNIIQTDDLGYPLMLVIESCPKCGNSRQSWVDVSPKIFDKLNTGECTLLKWTKVDHNNMV